MYLSRFAQCNHFALYMDVSCAKFNNQVIISTRNSYLIHILILYGKYEKMKKGLDSKVGGIFLSRIH